MSLAKRFPRRSAAHSSCATALALLACGPLAGIEEKPCRPGCVDEHTKLVCDAHGAARAVPCPEPTDPCAAAYCSDSVCGLRPAVGKTCGPKKLARCNEGYACLGPDLKLTAGFTHTCALDDEGKVWCWGRTDYGRLGNGSNDSHFAGNPVPVAGLPKRVVTVSGGFAHTCALVEGGEAYCWGDNNYGKAVPDAPADYLTTATRVTPMPEGVRFTDIRAAGSHSCALATDGTVYCWGATDSGECGIDGNAVGRIQTVPVRVPNLDNVKGIEAVKNHTCAIRTAAPSLVCWGDNRYEEVAAGQQPFIVHKLGPNAAALEYSPVPVPVDFPGQQVIAVGMGYDATYALVGQGMVAYAFGLNTSGQLGTGSTDPIGATPATVKMRGIQDFVMNLPSSLEMVRMGASNQCIKLSTGPYFCWGTDKNGELGMGGPIGQKQTYAVQPAVLPPSAKNMVHAESHACVTVTTQERTREERTEIWCYGNNALVGNGSTDPSKKQLEAAPVVWTAE